MGSTPRTGEILRAESTGALASTDIFAAAVQGGIGDYTAQLQTLRSDAAAAEAAIDPMAAPQTGPLTRMQELARTALGAVGSAMTLVAYASPGAVYLAPPGWDWHAPAEADSARTRATVCAAHDASTSQPSELLPPPDADAFSDTVIRDSQRDDTRYESASGMAAEGWAGSQASHAAGQQGGARPSLLAAALERAQSQSGLLPVAHARGLASTDHSAPHNLDPEPLIDVVFVHGMLPLTSLLHGMHSSALRVWSFVCYVCIPTYVDSSSNVSLPTSVHCSSSVFLRACMCAETSSLLLRGVGFLCGYRYPRRPLHYLAQASCSTEGG